MSGLERVTVLIVEDAMQIRTLLASSMRRIGVGNVLHAADGLKAIELLKEIQHNPMKVGASEVDLIISDWVMEPVDGITLLRWVRRHKDSPDRYMPFFLISAHSDQSRVTQARDLGVTEFMAKPFRINDLISHVEATVKDERRFVRTDSYFGPDRRRRSIPVEVERRNVGETTAKFLDPPRRLFSKVGGELEIAEEEITAAEEEVADMANDFLDWAQEDLEKLNRAFEQSRGSEDPEVRLDGVRRIAMIAHEYRGQAGVFGYPLISIVAESLFRLTNSLSAVPDESLELIRTHIDLVRAILREDISGEGGDLGPELMNSLKLACHTFVSKPENERLVSREFVRHTSTGIEHLLRNASALDTSQAV